MVAGQSVHPGGLPIVPPGTEWAVGLTVRELRRSICAPGQFKAVVPPTPGRIGFADYVVKRCIVSFGLALPDGGGEPVVETVLAETLTGKLMSFPEAADCFASVRPDETLRSARNH